MSAKLEIRRGVEERNKLVVQWRYLPRHVAKSISLNYIGLEDAEQAGMLGLIRAAELWDERRKVSFTTYAWYWIKNRIQDADVKYMSVIIPANCLRDPKRLPQHILEKC